MTPKRQFLRQILSCLDKGCIKEMDKKVFKIDFPDGTTVIIELTVKERIRRMRLVKSG